MRKASGIGKQCPFTMLAALVATGILALAPAAQSQDVGFDIRIDHVGISVGNLEESVDWYVNMLGFELTRPINRNPDSDSTIARVVRDGFSIELFEMRGAEPLPEYRKDPSADLRVHGLAHFAFEVDDAIAVMEELESKGVEVVLPPRDREGPTFFFVSDNSGNTFEFIQRR